MKTIKLLFLLVMIGLFSNCSAKKETGTQDGSSYEKAIIVKSVSDEYSYIRKKCPTCKTKAQALVFQGDKPFDVITVVQADGTEMDYYFDISTFFGQY